MVITPSPCATCGKVQDLATRTLENHEMPEEGDACVCLNCASANQYGAGMRLEPLDWAKLDDETRERVRRLQRTIAASKRGGAS
jgi:hypothetical protein